MHPVRPLKNNNENDRRSERYEEMSKEVVVDGMDTKVSPIPEEDVAEEAEDQVPAIPEEDMAEDVEAQAPLVARAPSKPSRAEVDLHGISLSVSLLVRALCQMQRKGRLPQDRDRSFRRSVRDSSSHGLRILHRRRDAQRDRARRESLSACQYDCIGDDGDAVRKSVGLHGPVQRCIRTMDC